MTTTLPPRPGAMPGLWPKAGAAPATKFAFEKINPAKALRIAIYGTGGIGKTTLACTAPGPVAVIDLDGSLGVLMPTGDVRKIGGIETWTDLRGALAQADLFSGIRTVIIDSLTRAEPMAIAHALATVPHEKGGLVQSIEGYGFGKGLQHVYDTFLPLFADLDAHVRAGRNVILLCHDCTANVPNPAGVDYIRYEPRLQSPASGKASIRHTLKEWCDHLLFIGYDVAAKDGKAVGSGTRTIYPNEMPTFTAKSRSLSEPIVYAQGSTELWDKLFPKG